MFNRALLMVSLLVVLILTLVLITLVLPRLVTFLHARGRTYNIQDAPSKPVAIVFGAGLWYDGSPTPILRDRIASAAALYHAGKVTKILMSGDNSTVDYNEPGAMKDFAIQLGVPENDIVLDYAGRRTYDTCYRAGDIFGLQEVILVTQGFHLPRTIYTCNALGTSAVGVDADIRTYRRRSLLYWNLRELPATAIALWQVHVSHPEPVLGNPEPIFPLEAQ
ncbi:MAG: YdcF family protein [Anaerolineales bacterium]|nr:YdcF family protein [Anaerolineales bacterium]